MLSTSSEVVGKVIPFSTLRIRHGLGVLGMIITSHLQKKMHYKIIWKGHFHPLSKIKKMPKDNSLKKSVNSSSRGMNAREMIKMNRYFLMAKPNH